MAATLVSMPVLSRLREQRVQQALSQDDLARLARMSRTTVIRAEQLQPARLSTWRKLARALRVKPSDLIGPLEDA